MMSWAFNASAEQVKRALKSNDFPWLDQVQIFFIVLAVIMGVFALFFLIIGCTATGATRDAVYSSNDMAKCGGKFACILAMLFDLLLMIGWLFIISLVSMLSIAYFFFDQLCSHLPDYSEGDCLDLHVFWPLVAKITNSNLRLCGGDVQQFCALSSTAFSWYVIGWVGSVLVLIGLLVFFGVHASNYAHIGNSSRYIELEQHHFVTDSRNDPRSEKNWRQTPTTHFAPSTHNSDTMFDSISQYEYRRDRRAKY